jgi:hypothetical protein
MREMLEALLNEDPVTLARALRLSTMIRFVRSGILNKDSAMVLVNQNLSPNNPSTYYDDRKLLEDYLFKFEQYGTLDPEIIDLIERILNPPIDEYDDDSLDVWPEYGCTPLETFWERLVRWFKHLFKTRKDII